MNHAPASIVRDPRPVRRFAAAVLLAVLATSCGSAAASPAATPPSQPASVAPASPSVLATATPTSAPATPAPTGPAVASLAFVGDPAVASALANAKVRCQVPTTGGMSISVVTSDPASAVYVVVTLSPSSISVSLRSGAAASYRERDFSGTGVKSFDPAHGAQVDGPLTEVTKAGTNTGTLGVVTSASGSVACGGQGPGTSTVRLTGTLPEGQLDSLLDPVRVDCNTYSGGHSISAQGIVTVGGTPTMVIVNVIPDQFTVFVVTAPKSHYLTAKGAGVGALTGPTTATLSGDAVDAPADSSPALAVHAIGTLTCSS